MRVFQTILNMSVAGGIIILAVLFARLLLRKAPKWTRLVLWGIVALRLAVPVFIESPLSLMPRAAEVDVAAVEAELMSRSVSAATTAPTVTSEPKATDLPKPTQAPAATQAPAGQSPVITQNPSATVSPLGPISGRAGDGADRTDPKLKFDWIGAVGAVWAAGVFGMLAYAVISWAALKKRLSTAVRLEGNVYETEYAKTPFLLGIFSPKIYLPFGMEAHPRELVLLHENAHMKGLDHIIKPLGYLILSAHWFNPLAWLAYVLFSKDLELACDERVIKNLDPNGRADYSQALLDLSVRKRRIAACPLAFGESNVKERVKNVINYKKPAFWIIIAAVLVTVFITGCFMTNPRRIVEHRLITISEASALADENGWVVIPDDYSCSIAKGTDVWDLFVEKVNLKAKAEVVLVMRNPNPIEGKYKDIEDTLGDYPAVFKKIAFDGVTFRLSISSVYPVDFENIKTFGYLGSALYPGGDCWQYYLADEPLLDLSSDETFKLYEGEAYPLFKLSGVNVSRDSEPYAYAKEHGWVAVDVDNRYVCGEEQWELFLENTENKVPAEITLITAEEVELLLDSDPKGVEFKGVFVTELRFDGTKFTVRKKLWGTEEFNEPREFGCLNRIGVGYEPRYSQFVLMNRYVDPAERDSIEPYCHTDDIWPLFMVVDEPRPEFLSELSRGEIIAFLKDCEIGVEEIYYDESFDLNEVIRTIEHVPYSLVELAIPLPDYAEYDLCYAVELYGRGGKPDKPVISHMGREGCVKKLAELRVKVPDDMETDPRYFAAELEKDINVTCPFESPSPEYTLFQDMRIALFWYYDMSWLLLTDERAYWEEYKAACASLVNPAAADYEFFVMYSGEYVTLAFVDGAFRAWDERKTYIEKLDGSDSYRYEYQGLLAEFPPELWEVCAEKLSNYHYEYLNWGWEPGEPYIGPYPKGLICENGFLCMTEPWQDRQANVIMHRYSDGEWREFGNSNMGYPYIPSGLLILDDETGFVCYQNCYEYVSSEGPHEANWVNVWATYDGGNTWECLGLELPERYKEAYPYPIALSPVYDGTRIILPVKAFISGNPYIAWFISEDGGHSWSLGGERIICEF